MMKQANGYGPNRLPLIILLIILVRMCRDFYCFSSVSSRRHWNPLLMGKEYFEINCLLTSDICIMLRNPSKRSHRPRRDYFR